MEAFGKVSLQLVVSQDSNMGTQITVSNSNNNHQKGTLRVASPRTLLLVHSRVGFRRRRWAGFLGRTRNCRTVSSERLGGREKEKDVVSAPPLRLAHILVQHEYRTRGIDSERNCNILAAEFYSEKESSGLSPKGSIGAG
jgi:hypothetical protein